MDDDNQTSHRGNFATSEHGAPRIWIASGGLIVFAILVAAGWLGWRFWWCPRHNYCQPTETSKRSIPNLDDPKKDDGTLGFVLPSAANSGEDFSPTGPSSFAVSNGNLAIADTVKQRVAVFDANGLNFKYSVDEFQFPPIRVDLAGDDLLVRATYGLSDNDSICSIASRHCRKLADSASLAEVSALRKRASDMACNPNRPTTPESRNLEQGRASCAPDISRELIADAPNLLTVNPIGRDRNGNFYVLIQQGLEGKSGLVSTIRKYSPKQLLVATSLPLPLENSFDLSDSIRVDEDGTCYALLVRENNVQVWNWVTHAGQ